MRRTGAAGNNGKRHDRNGSRGRGMRIDGRVAALVGFGGEGGHGDAGDQQNSQKQSD